MAGWTHILGAIVHAGIIVGIGSHISTIALSRRWFFRVEIVSFEDYRRWRDHGWVRYRTSPAWIVEVHCGSGSNKRNSPCFIDLIRCRLSIGDDDMRQVRGQKGTRQIGADV